eukprot:8284700-Pyramimonas_sp.AAC.1
MWQCRSWPLAQDFPCGRGPFSRRLLRESAFSLFNVLGAGMFDHCPKSAADSMAPISADLDKPL